METDPSHRRSFVVQERPAGTGARKALCSMAPHRILPILTTPVLSWRGKLRVLMDLVIPRRDEDSEESLASFVSRRLGREALERLVQPLVGGIYTGDPNDLSLKATLPQYLAMEREHGSLIRAAWRQRSRDRATRQHERQASGARYGMFVSLADGMDVLPRTLAAALAAGNRSHQFRRPAVEPQRAGLSLAGRAAGRAAAGSRCRDRDDRGSFHGPDDRHGRPWPGSSASRDPLRLVDHRQRRLPSRPGPAPARRLWRRGPGDRAPIDPGGLVLERQVPQPRARGHGALARLHRRRHPARAVRSGRRRASPTWSPASWPA